MPVNISISGADVMAKVEGAFNKALPMMANEILNDCNQYCKEDTGMLIASSLIHSRLDEGLLVWQTPYAKRQYWEIRTAYTDVNPNATWRWCEVAKRQHMARWERQMQRLVEMGL